MSDKSFFLVFSNPAEGKDEEFNEWYDAVHVPEVTAVPGVVSGQRFDVHERAADDTQAPPPPTHRYLTVYELDGDIDAIMTSIGDRVMAGTMSMSDALDRDNTVISFWVPRGPKVES